MDPQPSTSSADVKLRQAIRAEIIERGVAGVTMTSLAQAAGVSRMTAYRRGSSVERILLDALTEEVRQFVPDSSGISDPDDIADMVIQGLTAVTETPLFKAVQKEAPELLFPYAVERLGAVQELLRARLQGMIESGQAQGRVRPGDPARCALAILVAVQGFALMRELPSELAQEARELVVRYLQVEERA